MLHLLMLVAVILLTFAFEIIYEWLAARFFKPETPELETMESMMNNGCQISVRMVLFGILSCAIVFGVFVVFCLW